MINYWNPPLYFTQRGLALHAPLVDGDILPFRCQNSPSGTSATTPSSTSAPSPISAPTDATKHTLPSAHLLYIREILTRAAHVMGVTGYAEYGYYDGDSDMSVLTSDTGGEETGKLSDPEQTQEEISQIAAWAEISSSYIV